MADYFGMDEAEIMAQLTESPEIDTQLDDFMENEVVPVWQDNSPVDTREYVDSVQVTKAAQGGKGQVGATDDVANIIEYGSEDTPEFAPRAKTEAHFSKPGR